MHDINITHHHEVVEEHFAGCCLDCKQSLEIIKPHILSFHDRVSKLSQVHLPDLNAEELYGLYSALDDIAHLKVGDHLAELVLKDKDIERLLPEVRIYYTNFFDIHEKHLAREISETTNDPWDIIDRFPLLDRYLTLTKNHTRALSFRNDRSIAFLGCGHLPMTAFLLAKIHGSTVTAIDIDSEAVENARRCIRKLALSEKIEVIHGNEDILENLLDKEPHDILVAAMAEPKKQIFASIEKFIDNYPTTTVSYRTYTGIRAILYKPFLPDEIHGFQPIETIPPTGRVNNTTIFLQRVSREPAAQTENGRK